MKRYLVFALALLAITVFANGALAATSYNDENITITDTAIYPNTDAALTLGKTGNTFSNLSFGSTLVATGRVNAASTVASSSTNLAPTNLPYSIIRKYIGTAAASLDNSDGGTRLQNGTPGQILVLLAQDVGTSGTWTVTPKTSLAITTLSFDAKGETATLLFVDTTIGWVLISNEGVTVVIKMQTGIPSVL